MVFVNIRINESDCINFMFLYLSVLGGCSSVVQRFFSRFQHCTPFFPTQLSSSV